MTQITTAPRLSILIVCGLLLLGGIGCREDMVQIDESQAALARQRTEFQQSREPIPVPDGAREILANQFAYVSDFRFNSDQSNALVVGHAPPVDPGLQPSDTFVVDMASEKILARYKIHLPSSCASPNRPRLAAIGHTSESVADDSTPTAAAQAKGKSKLDPLAERRSRRLPLEFTTSGSALSITRIGR